MSDKRTIKIECVDGALIVDDSVNGRCVVKQPYNVKSDFDSCTIYAINQSGRTYIPFVFVDTDLSFKDFVSTIEQCACEPQSFSLDGITLPPLEIEKQLQFGAVCDYYLSSEDGLPFKKRQQFKIQQICLKDGRIVYVEFGKDINDENNYLNIENYTNMSYSSTAPVQEDLRSLITTGTKTICIPAATTLTFADILAAFVADGTLLPDGTAPTGLLNTEIMPIHAGYRVKDTNGDLKKIGTGYIEVDGESLNAGVPFCKKDQPVQDGDCDGRLRGEDLTTTIENVDATKTAAFTVTTCLIPLDTDDNDESV